MLSKSRCLGDKARVLAGIQIISGILAIIIEIIKVSIIWEGYSLSTTGEGLYCGLLLLVPGLLGSLTSGHQRLVWGLQVLASVAAGWLTFLSGCKLAGSLVHMAWLPPIPLHLMLLVTGLLGLGSSLVSAGPGCPQCLRCCQDQEPPVTCSVSVAESNLHEESHGKSYTRFP